MDWEECRFKWLVKEVAADKNLIKSLMTSSSKKLYTQSLVKLDENTASSKISLTYDALRELLEALALSKGYKIYNHECYAGFLKEILNESSKADRFDSFRKIRNAINYYGRDVAVEEAEEIIRQMLELISALKDKYFEDKKA